MNNDIYDNPAVEIAWCPGCGDFPILKTLKETLAELEIDPRKLVMVSGIGQAAKIPHYIRANVFDGLHGRSLPPATAIKAANPALTVIVEGGDGDGYGEGGNHFMHTIRRNPDITNIIHNNMVYGLTKGQASPTSRLGYKTPVQVNGVILEPFNPLAVAISLGATFVARSFAGDPAHMKEMMTQAIRHRGYSLLDILQPCVSFNKFNTYKWFKDNTYYLDESHDPGDYEQAYRRAMEQEMLPLGVLYHNAEKATFEDNIGLYRDKADPLYKRTRDMERIQELLDRKT